MDILDILLDILLKPPQPLMGLFFNLSVKINKCEVEISIFVLLFVEKIKKKNTLTMHSYFLFL